MKNILIILLLLTANVSYGQLYNYFAVGRTTDTATTSGSLMIPYYLRLPSYGTTDTNKVIGLDASGKLVLRTKTTSSGGGVTTQQLADSVALRVKYTDTAAMLANYAIEAQMLGYLGLKMDIADSGTAYYTVYGVDTAKANIRGAYKANSDSFPTTGYTTRARLQKVADSINAIIAALPTYAAGWGLTGGFTVDSYAVSSRARLQKVADSVTDLIPDVTGYVPYTGATSNLNMGTHNVTATRLNVDTIVANTSAGLHIHNTSHQDILIAGAGGGQTMTIYASTNLDQVKIQNSTDTVLTTTSSGTIGKAAIASVYLKSATAASTYVAATTTSVNTVPIVSGSNNTVTASAATLTTTTLNPTVVTSSLTSVGTISSGTWSSTIGSAATGSTQAINNNSTQIATTAYVDRYHPADTTISAAYTLTSRDFCRTIHCTNGSNIALTIPTGLGTTFVCVVLAEGAGTVTPTTSSTTFYYQPTSTTKIKSQGGATIRSWATANSYLIIGSLE